MVNTIKLAVCAPNSLLAANHDGHHLRQMDRSVQWYNVARRIPFRDPCHRKHGSTSPLTVACVRSRKRSIMHWCPSEERGHMVELGPMRMANLE